MVCCDLTNHFSSKELNLWLLLGKCTPSILLGFTHILLQGNQLCDRSGATRLHSSLGQKKKNETEVRKRTKQDFFFLGMGNEMWLCWEETYKEMFTWKFIMSMFFIVVSRSWSKGVLQGCPVFMARRGCAGRTSSPERVTGGQDPDGAQWWELSQSSAQRSPPNPNQYQHTKY